MNRNRKPKPDFEIWLRKKYPEQVSVRAVADLIGALKGLVGVPDDGNDDEAPSIALLDICRGSATYRCTASRAEEVLPRLKTIGECLRQNRIDPGLADRFVDIRRLSKAAHRAECDIVVRRTGGERSDILATFTPKTYHDLKSAHTIRGQTSLLCRVVRVGGATRPRCMVRIPGQNKAVYCSVSQKLARELGPLLYREVVLEGEAVWVRDTRRVVEFDVRQVVGRRGGKFSQARQSLRRAGADRWDTLPDCELLFSKDQEGEDD
ncbi:MAG: hypothetical protein ACLFVU_07920 [Phycisphaerae bacterium]